MVDPKKYNKFAVIGASDNKTKYGYKVLKFLINKGKVVYPVNPRKKEIEGIPCYKSVKELPKDVDLLVFIVPPSIGIDIAKEAVDAGFTNLWFQPGAESDEIYRFLKSKGIEPVFNRCVMLEM